MHPRKGDARLFLILFRIKSGKFGIIRKSKSVGFFSHYLIKFRKGCFDIGLNKKLADTAEDKSYKYPANEGEIENEDLPFFAFGHFFGKFKSAFGRDLGVFCKDIGYHGIFIGFDDSGNDKKQAPKENFNFFPEHDFYDVEISSFFECPEDSFKTGTKTAVFHKITVFADDNRAGNKCAPTKSDYESDYKTKDQEEDCGQSYERVAEKVFEYRADFIKEVSEEFIHKSDETCGS